MARTGRPKVELVKVECASCGVPLLRYPSVYNKNKTKRFFCEECSLTSGFKPRTGTMAKCEECDHEYYRRKHEEQSGRRFCSKPCYDRWQGRNSVVRICEICETEFLLRPAHARQTSGKFCSRRCDGMSKRRRVQDRLHNGKPVLLTLTGYLKRWEPSRPPHRRWVLEHRAVMEQAIGRALLPTEHVHHINCDKTDNRLDNLEIIDPSTHSRVTNQNKMERQLSEREKLAEYERRFGPLEL